MVWQIGAGGMRKRFQNDSGGALVAVLVMAVIFNFAFLAVNYTVGNATKKSGFRRMNISAINIAEAGKEQALSSFRSGGMVPSANSTVTLFDSIPFGNGHYTVVASTDEDADTVIISSTGFVNEISKTIVVICQVGDCQSPDDSAYNYGIISGGGMTWSGSGTCNTGSAMLHTNGAFQMSGSSNFYCGLLSSVAGITMKGSGDIVGSAIAPNIAMSGNGEITGSKTIGTVNQVSIPSIDLTPYYEHALAHGQVVNGIHITGSSSTVIPGGVLWVNGNFKYSGSGNVTGSIIATGSVTISGSGNFTAVDKYPAIVSRDSDITMSGSGRVSGLIYARVGKLKKSGSGDVTGSMMCGGEFVKSGSWNTLTYMNSAPVAPNCSQKTYTEVAWQEL